MIGTLRLGASLALACLMSSVAWAQTPPAATTLPASAIPADKPLGSGPDAAIMEMDPSLPTHTLYHPADMAASAGQPLPIVVWGNGACVNAGNRFRWFLSEIASYGYFVVALGPIGSSALEAGPAPPAPLPPGAPRPPLGPPQTHTPQLIQAIDWAIAQNNTVSGRFYHRLDPTKVAVMGQSCGGVQAIEASADPRVKTTMVWNSGLTPNPTDMAGGKTMTKEDLKRLHGPMAYISGDAEDIAFPNANDDFERISGLMVFRGYERGQPHTGTYREPNGGEFGGVAVAWLNWRLKDDQHAALMFKGADCGLCVNPRWMVRKKNLD